MMSTSLEKDLHSVYIDGEMPESFVSQYESIVQADPNEKARLEKMRRLHLLLQEESDAMTKKITGSAQDNPSDTFIEESFARLQTKMRYAKNVELANEQKSFVSPFIKYASSFVAAAAVFAVVFIPVHNNSLKNAKETAVAAISIMKEKGIEPIAQKEVVIDGNINKEDLPKVLAVKSETKKNPKLQIIRRLQRRLRQVPALQSQRQKILHQKIQSPCQWSKKRSTLRIWHQTAALLQSVIVSGSGLRL